MKIERTDIFRPITIVLETEDEARALTALVKASVATATENAHLELYGTKSYAHRKIDILFQSLRASVPEPEKSPD